MSLKLYKQSRDARNGLHDHLPTILFLKISSDGDRRLLFRVERHPIAKEGHVREKIYFAIDFAP